MLGRVSSGGTAGNTAHYRCVYDDHLCHDGRLVRGNTDTHEWNTKAQRVIPKAWLGSTLEPDGVAGKLPGLCWRFADAAHRRRRSDKE